MLIQLLRSWELRIWSPKVNFLDILITSPQYFYQKSMGTRYSFLWCRMYDRNYLTPDFYFCRSVSLVPSPRLNIEPDFCRTKHCISYHVGLVSSKMVDDAIVRLNQRWFGFIIKNEDNKNTQHPALLHVNHQQPVHIMTQQNNQLSQEGTDNTRMLQQFCGQGHKHAFVFETFLWGKIGKYIKKFRRSFSLLRYWIKIADKIITFYTCQNFSVQH